MARNKGNEIDFKPETGWGWFILWCAIYGALGFVFFQELSQSIDFNTWGDRVGATLFMLFAFWIFYAVCLYLIFNPRRFSFTDSGLHVWTWRGLRYIPWQMVQRATLSKVSLSESYLSKQWIFVGLLLRPGVTVDIPIEMYKRRGSLLAQLQRWLPHPLLDPKGLETHLVNDPSEK